MSSLWTVCWHPLMCSPPGIPSCLNTNLPSYWCSPLRCAVLRHWAPLMAHSAPWRADVCQFPTYISAVILERRKYHTSSMLFFYLSSYLHKIKNTLLFSQMGNNIAVNREGNFFLNGSSSSVYSFATLRPKGADSTEQGFCSGRLVQRCERKGHSHLWKSI